MKIHYGRTTGPILLKFGGELDLSLLHPPFHSPPGVLRGGGLRGCRVSDAGFVASSLTVRANSRPPSKYGFLARPAMSPTARITGSCVGNPLGSVLGMGGMNPLFGEVHNFVKSLPNDKCSYTLCIMSYHRLMHRHVPVHHPGG